MNFEIMSQHNFVEYDFCSGNFCLTSWDTFNGHEKMFVIFFFMKEWEILCQITLDVAYALRSKCLPTMNSLKSACSVLTFEAIKTLKSENLQLTLNKVSQMVSPDKLTLVHNRRVACANLNCMLWFCWIRCSLMVCRDNS